MNLDIEEIIMIIILIIFGIATCWSIISPIFCLYMIYKIISEHEDGNYG